MTIFDTKMAENRLAALASLSRGNASAVEAVLADAYKNWGGSLRSALLQARDGSLGEAAEALQAKLPASFGWRKMTALEMARENVRQTILAATRQENARRSAYDVARTEATVGGGMMTNPDATTPALEKRRCRLFRACV